MPEAKVSLDSLLGLDGKAAVITGAGGGFGREFSIILSKIGANVVLLDIASVLVEETAAMCREAAPGCGVQVCVGDVSQPNCNTVAVKTCVESFGSCDIFWANAGVIGSRRQPGQNSLTDISADTWRQTMSINLDGVFFGYQAAARQMMKQPSGGSIIGTASVAGLLAGAGPPDYSVTKAGVVQLTRTAALALAGRNIRVNCICPGLIASNLTFGMLQDALSNAEISKQMDAMLWNSFRNPLLRYGKLSDVAHAALFLSSKMGAFVNGQAIAVDGGMSSVYSVSPVDDNLTPRSIPSFSEGNEEYREYSRTQSKL